jgi:hypothetical protein
MSCFVYYSEKNWNCWLLNVYLFFIFIFFYFLYSVLVPMADGLDRRLLP